MKIVTIKNLMFQFDTDDDNADSHTATNILEKVNEILAERSDEVGGGLIFISAIDDDDIEINEDEVIDSISITAIDKHSGDSTSRNFSTTNEFLLKSMVSEWEKEVPYRRYELVTGDDLDDYSPEVQTVLEDLEVSN